MSMTSAEDINNQVVSALLIFAASSWACAMDTGNSRKIEARIKVAFDLIFIKPRSLPTDLTGNSIFGSQTAFEDLFSASLVKNRLNVLSRVFQFLYQ